jgi:N-acetylmuramic acid 6-phosphate etherase
MSLKFAEELAALSTEKRNPRSTEIDRLDNLEILRIINQEDKKVPSVVERELEYVSKAIELIVKSLESGGRLIYVGAGTSGRLGILDASECPPTFGTTPETILGMIAGGNTAVFRSQEGAEDDEVQAVKDINNLRVNGRDTVCGVAASRRTPYVVAAISRAKELGARTIYVTTNPRREFSLDVDVAICPEVGPEVIMGSTRMKSGTAQKLVLNMLTTTSMIKLGKVYENMMVDLQLTNDKLVERAKRIIMMATGIDYELSERQLKAAGGHVKTAIVMSITGLSREEASKRLDQNNGFIRDALTSKENR